MISREEYLKALETVREYKKQIKTEKKQAEEVLNSKFLTEFDIPLNLQKLIGKHYDSTENGKHINVLRWDQCFALLTIGDLRKAPYRIEDLIKFRGIGDKTIAVIKKLYKEIGLI